MIPSVSESCFLGIDIGSVSLSYVLMNRNRQIIKSSYLFHYGNIFSILANQLAAIDLTQVDQIAYNHKSSDFFNRGISVNEQVAIIESVRFIAKEAGSVFIIGGETFGLILFDEAGRYQKYISNSSCAAGTGAFLDQQAERLGLSDSAELSRLAESFQGDAPKIATRCAVFAKTDLIHCQQQGYSIEAISAGLCKGLAHNIADTLVKGIKLRQPVVVVGGVSKNKKVVQYLSEIIGCPIEVFENAELAGAIGCALSAANQAIPSEGSAPVGSIFKLLKQQTNDRQYFFPPLTSQLSAFPCFDDHRHYVAHQVEIDLYDLAKAMGAIPVFLGIDIGSTSTKATLMNARSDDQAILLGLYTRTMSQPIKAIQVLFRVLREIETEYEVQFEFLGVGTTGSGRKFIQKVIHSDMAIDEITAHARAAIALNPKVDTIIEIGGQDSKFTVLRDGQVTFSTMNYVCAAGTGSFIEEQAKRLNVALHEYSEQAIGTPSPLTSDRCTVFMERDLNHFLSQGYSTPELLAAVLHSVRDNYLSKVAHLNKIGNVICFQGATAKNTALVIAFEQKLQKPIFVSKYCHLTGALGVCLLLKEDMEKSIAADDRQTTNRLQYHSRFRGIDFYKESPMVIDEICDGCKNHCKLKRIRISNEDVVWGYLCGRDDSGDGKKPHRKSGFDLLSSRRQVLTPKSIPAETLSPPSKKINKSFLEELKKFDFDLALEKVKHIDIPIDKLKQIEFDLLLDKIKQGVGFNLLNLRHKLFTFSQDEIQIPRERKQIKIGIPGALYMQEYLPFWQFMFRKLGYSVIVSDPRPDFLNAGKEIAGAEFCAPISYWHGQVQELSKQVDYLFLPHMFAGGKTNDPQFYCYYSNYAVVLVQNIESLELKDRCISPMIDFSKTEIDNIRQIYEHLPIDLKLGQTPNEIQEAYQQAWRWFLEQKKQLIEIFRQQWSASDKMTVVLLGRPYLILDRGMNKNIPQKFNDLGIITFFQDMLPLAEGQSENPAQEFIEWNHWKYGATILKAADYIGRNQGLYPVILTAFKCSPDSFVVNYFKEIMDAYQKPYLILQIDEHGSDVGYDTRIEAAIRAFRHHFQQSASTAPARDHRSILRSHDKQGTILIPNYDPLSCSLICAAFEHAGYQAKLIEETATSILSSLRLNDGQCLPVSAITASAIDTIKKYNLEPEHTAIFLNAISRMACNFPQYPLMTKKLLEQHGAGFEKVQIFATEFDMREFPFEVIYDVYCSYLLSGLLRRLSCKIRPYEIDSGQTNQVIEASRLKLYQCIARGESKEVTFKEIIAELKKIPVHDGYGIRPNVCIIGDLYVRDNDVFNQRLIDELEHHGAEVVTTPYSYILRMLAVKHNYNLKEDGYYLKLLRDKLFVEVLEKFEKRFFQIANEILKEDFPTFDESIFSQLPKYNLSLQHGGESAQNVMKIFSLLQHYPDLRMFIHVNPIFCCPGLVSESLFKKIEKDIGIPIVSITYDGTLSNRNEVLVPYLHYITESKNRSVTR